MLQLVLPVSAYKPLWGENSNYGIESCKQGLMLIATNSIDMCSAVSTRVITNHIHCRGDSVLSSCITFCLIISSPDQALLQPGATESHIPGGKQAYIATSYQSIKLKVIMQCKW